MKARTYLCNTKSLSSGYNSRLSSSENHQISFPWGVHHCILRAHETCWGRSLSWRIAWGWWPWCDGYCNQRNNLVSLPMEYDSESIYKCKIGCYHKPSSLHYGFFKNLLRYWFISSCFVCYSDIQTPPYTSLVSLKHISLRRVVFILIIFFFWGVKCNDSTEWGYIILMIFGVAINSFIICTRSNFRPTWWPCFCIFSSRYYIINPSDIWPFILWGMLLL